MPKKLDDCVKKLKEEGKDESQAYAICNASFQDKAFTDSLHFDSSTKTAISVRDGVQEYLGAELELEPADKTFTIYRSPATVSNCVSMLDNLPLTNEHVSLDSAPDAPCGSVLSSILIDSFDKELNSTLAIKNQINLDKSIMDALHSGKRELSLGYNAKLIPHDTYDFEQTDMTPHHLAVVDRGRCGAICTFIDKHKGEDMKKIHKVFLDEEGQPSLEEIVAIATSLPDAIKKLDAEMLAKVMPTLREIVGAAKSEDTPAEEEAEGETTDAEADPKKEEDQSAMDADSEADKEKDKVAVTDSRAFRDALTKSVDKALALHTEVIEKARGFVDDAYSFKGKKTCQVMRDALKAEHGSDEFTDEELSVAFKLLKKTTDLKNFGDSKPNEFQLLADKEI